MSENLDVADKRGDHYDYKILALIILNKARKRVRIRVRNPESKNTTTLQREMTDRIPFSN